LEQTHNEGGGGNKLAAGTSRTLNDSFETGESMQNNNKVGGTNKSNI